MWFNSSYLAKANIVAYNKHPLIQPTYSQHHTFCPLGTIKQNVWFNSSNLAKANIVVYNKHPLIKPTYSQHYSSCPLGTINQNVGPASAHPW